MSAPVRMAVVGLGYWGPNLVRCLHDIDGVEVSWLCDVRADLLEKVGRRYPAVGRTVCYQEVLDDADVDAVLIATPVSSHYPLAQRALDAGKHVFVEKPLAASTAEAEELVGLAQRRELVLMPGHTFLYSPPVQEISQLLAARELGDIYFISTSRVNLGLHQTDVSVAWDLGPHDFSILRHWLGETPSYVAALSRGCVFPGTPDVAFINLEFPSATIAHVELSWLAPSKLRRTTIVGSEKMVVYEDGSREPVRVFDSGVMLEDPSSFGEYQLTYRTGDIVSPNISPAEPLALELADFASCIRSGDTPRSSAQVGLDVVRIIEAVESSLQRDGARTPVGAADDIVAALAPK
ncbi:MAG TPA: Gfo/Idh/MocA family oxidoreductase [Gaiellaceae bacterium]|nr:Gfo/Idh/MocA family oxidoreductase [Gaiellaceae bacterium]